MDPITQTTKEKLHRRVCGELGQLINTFRLISAGGDHGINKAAEDFFCGLLNIVLDNDYPGIKLQNMNPIQPNYPAIDLGDAAQKVAVQVTTTENREKITHTLDKFFENNLDETYDRLIILIIGSKKSTKKSFPIQRNFDFDYHRDIWDIDRLGAVLGSLPEERLAQIVAYFSSKLYTETPGIRNDHSHFASSADMLNVLVNIQALLETIAGHPERQLFGKAKPAETTQNAANAKRIGDTPKTVDAIIQPLIAAHECGCRKQADIDAFDSLTLDALRKLVGQYGSSDYFFNLSIDIFEEKTADIIEDSLERILGREIPAVFSKRFEHKDIEALFCGYYALSLIYKKSNNLSALENLLSEKYAVFTQFPLYYEVQSRYHKRAKNLRKALELDQKALRLLQWRNVENYAVQNSYASTVAMMLAKRKTAAGVSVDEVETALRYIDNAREFNKEYPKYDFVKAQLLFYSHLYQKESLQEFESACRKAKELTDVAETKLYVLYRGRSANDETEQKKYALLRKEIDTELGKRKKAACPPKFERMTVAEAGKLKNHVLNSGSIPACCVPRSPYLEAEDEYIYVCFAKQDYKSVYCDLIELYRQKIPFVFHECTSNSADLFHLMQTHINNPKCLGMVFYISRHSLITPTFCEQVKLVFGRKPYFAVNLESDSLPSRIAIDTILDVCEKDAEKHPIEGEYLRAFLLAFDDKQGHTVKHKVYTEKGTEHFTHMKRNMIENFGLKISKEKK